jgi:hypothetical protein
MVDDSDEKRQFESQQILDQPGPFDHDRGTLGLNREGVARKQPAIAYFKQRAKKISSDVVANFYRLGYERDARE